jgi:hypothetical protein
MPNEFVTAEPVVFVYHIEENVEVFKEVVAHQNVVVNIFGKT